MLGQPDHRKGAAQPAGVDHDIGVDIRVDVRVGVEGTHR
jgi:hypothetical protein